MRTMKINIKWIAILMISTFILQLCTEEEIVLNETTNNVQTSTSSNITNVDVTNNTTELITQWNNF